MKDIVRLGALFSLIILLYQCGDNDQVQSSLPTVTTSLVTNITFTTADCGGIVTNNGGSNIINRGVCWSTSASPTINDNILTANLDTFTSNITGLSEHGETYYVRAYATNSDGTAYGNEQVFTNWNLGATKWAFLLNYNPSNNNYPGDVDFFADKTTKWDEPTSPGVYTTFGTWTVNAAVVTYNFTGDNTAASYIYTGTVVNNSTMSGTFTWGINPPKTFTATKYP